MSKSVPQQWENRIVGHGEESPAELMANPMNWRTHPKAQQKAMAEVLDEVGWVQSVIVNRTTGRLVDGHLRVGLAQHRNEAAIPVAYVDLSEEEERLILTTLDPIGALAGTDKGRLNDLLDQVSIQSEELEAMLKELGGAEEEQPENNIYTAEVNIPQYEIVGDKPAIAELFDVTKTEALRDEIMKADVPAEIREFLLMAAARHTIFNYRKAAEFYAHAEPAVQRLMEASAMVVIDLDDAIRNGYVAFTQTIAELEEEDRDAA